MKRYRLLVALFLLRTAAGPLCASENVPHAPFGEWAQVPPKGTLVFRADYQESESYHFWAGNNRYKIDFVKNGEHYGIDMNQGFVSLQYGLTERWTADLAFGFSTTGWRYFSNFGPSGSSQSTTGLMDSALGIRYRIFYEGEAGSWTPDLVFRAGAVLPGGFDETFPFAPGTRSTAIEPEFVARKHFGWRGLGIYTDGLFRWNHTSGNDLYIVSAGLFQQIYRWELAAGYRHLHSINGDSISFDEPTRAIIYPRALRENQDSFEGGFSYTLVCQLRLGFYSRTVFDGANTDKKFWVGCYVQMPLSLTRTK
jgi:hypothetical protein